MVILGMVYKLGLSPLLESKSSQNFPIDGFAKEVRRCAVRYRGHQQGASGSACPVEIGTIEKKTKLPTMNWKMMDHALLLSGIAQNCPSV